MKRFLIILLSLYACGLASRFHSELKPKWLAFKKIYNKSYENATVEQRRFSIFCENQKIIYNHNKAFSLGKVTFSMKSNQFADLTRDEFVDIYLSRSQEKGAKPTKYSKPSSLAIGVPPSVDWRLNGSVTEVRDQGKCGSSYAFATTGALEAQYFDKNGVLVKFSEQNLLDCTGNAYNNSGCGGGNVQSSLIYVQKTNGIDTDESYPYQASVGSCKFNAIHENITIKSIERIEPDKEWLLQTAIATIGPIAVNFDASLDSFRFYSTGIYYDFACSKTNGNHFALAIGYGTEKNRLGYYIVKNSWSKSWGESGYIRMARFYNNNCGIASNALYPVV